MRLIYPVILCGGSGTRLWPVSRKSMPKQFVQLVGEKTLFQQACARCADTGFAPPIIITCADYRFIVAQQLAEIEIEPKVVLLEPEGKNTAPAILAAASYLRHQDAGDLMIVMPSDHYIPDDAAFKAMLARCVSSALDGQFLTFGVVPDRPETGYGYIEAAEMSAVQTVIPVQGFHEKPDEARAQNMIESGQYLWNAGIFMATAQAFIEAGEHFVPDMVRLTEQAVTKASSDLDFLRLETESWAMIRGDSIDYALMEKAQNISVVKFSGSWSDLGDWQAVKRQLGLTNGALDDAGNFIEGNAVQVDTEQSLLWSDTGGQALVTVGLSNIAVIAMPDAVLVSDISQAQSVRKAVELLKLREVSEAEQHARDWRPWGWFESLVMADGYQVKRLHVYPGGELSLQSHEHRSEHWVVTAGQAVVQVEGSEFILNPNQSTYIEVGKKHRLSNRSELPLTIIEVQTGSYLGEDDIIRYEDTYKRQ